jgi:hypothetical protein
MSVEKLPENLWPLADPAQEVLIERRSAFSQLAPVPLCRLGIESPAAGEPYLPRAGRHSD